MQLSIDAHPLLELGWIQARFPQALGTMETPAALRSWMQPGAPAPMSTDDALRKAVRDLLRQGGYRPTGRGKPASEYLHGVWQTEPLPSINPAVDVCNVVSLHSGLPISVVDLERASSPLRVGLAAQGMSYVFNLSGQSIDLEGLLCLFDAQGPCANAVKDAQRTKTDAKTSSTLSLIWGTRALPGRTAQALRWYQECLEAAGARVEGWGVG